MAEERMGIVSGHGEVIDERGREFDPRTERDAPNGDARFGATGPVRSPYRANATVHGMTDSNPLLNVERQNPLFCSTPTNTYAAEVRSSRDRFLLIVLPDRNLAAIGLDDALQHTCAGQSGVGSLLTADIACTFCQQVGRGSLYI